MEPRLVAAGQRNEASGGMAAFARSELGGNGVHGSILETGVADSGERIRAVSGTGPIDRGSGSENHSFAARSRAAAEGHPLDKDIERFTLFVAA